MADVYSVSIFNAVHVVHLVVVVVVLDVGFISAGCVAREQKAAYSFQEYFTDYSEEMRVSISEYRWQDNKKLCIFILKN
jgi:hypothetical protein